MTIIGPIEILHERVTKLENALQEALDGLKKEYQRGLKNGRAKTEALERREFSKAIYLEIINDMLTCPAWIRTEDDGTKYRLDSVNERVDLAWKAVEASLKRATY